jgi:hypothetical protein
VALATELSYVPLGQLHPDPGNPRLPDDRREWSSDDDLLVYIADHFDPINVAESIAAHQYWPSEPLVVTREGDRNIVLEGNRRLAALLGLARPELRARFADGARWRDVAEQATITSDWQVPVLVAESRRDADALIGFRHITGIQQWSPFQRARFIAQLVREGKTFPDIAETVGEEEQFVKLHYRNQDILSVVRSAGHTGLASLGEQQFGTFTAALNRAGIREYVKVPLVSAVSETSANFDLANLARLEDLFGWVYGLEGRPKVIRETRDLTRLSDVIRNERAFDELARTRDLDTAFAMTGGAERVLYVQFAMAMGNLRSVAARADLLADDPRARELSVELLQLAEELSSLLSSSDQDQGT